MKKAAEKRQKRQKSIKARIRGNNLPSLSVFRSSKHIYATLVDPKSGLVVFGVSDKGLKVKGTKVEKAKEVGKIFAEKASKNKVKKIVFDRGGYLYHGRVKALAEGAREGGLDF